jgi:diguanylate cyclase (GGDEF)-like protein
MRAARRISWSKILIVIALLACAGLALATRRVAELDVAALRQASDTLRNSEMALLDLGDAESSQRDYLLTGDERELTPFLSIEAIACRRRMVQGPADGAGPRIKTLVSRFGEVCHARMTELRQTILVRRSGGQAAAVAAVRTDRGRVLMDQAKALTSQIQTLAVAQGDAHAVDLGRRMSFGAFLLVGLAFVGLVLVNARSVVSSLRRSLGAMEPAMARISGDAVARETPAPFAAAAPAAGGPGFGAADGPTEPIALVGRMANRLMGCADESEFVQVVETYAPRLLPGVAGALYALTPSRTSLRRIGAWNAPTRSALELTPGECRGLRGGGPHVVTGARGDVVCQHVRAGGGSVGYRCLPLVAQGETVGLLYLEDPEGVLASHEIRLQVLSETIAASLVNLRLRDGLRSQSIRDSLTGLFNRRYLEESLELECSRADRTLQPLSLIMADVDHFKQFNDSFGHEAGDIVLRQIADLLRRSARKGDVACRYGGEEFILMLPGSDLGAAIRLAERMRTAVHRLELAYRGRRMGDVTLSFGVAVYSAAAGGRGALIAAADHALYAAKAAGRNRVEPQERVALQPVAIG